MPPLSYKVLKYVLAGALLVLIYRLTYTVQQHEFFELITQYGTFFLIFLFILRYVENEREIRFFLLLGILLRLVPLFALPAWSDDVYRFVWDGRLIFNGYNPFDQLPSYYLEQGVAIEGIDQALYDQLNSPHYFTIYPPLAQAVFAFAVWISPQSVLGAAIVMKGLLFLAEVGSLFLILRLLRRFELPQKNVLLYALNPLIVVEIMGNLHFEGLMIFFLLLSIYWMATERIWLAAAAMGFSIASKLLPLMFLPFLIRRLGRKKSLIFFSVLALVVVLLFFPLLNGLFLSNFGESLNLYFRKFEFNASLYYILRYIGYWSSGYNMIHLFGPLLALLTFLSILLMALTDKQVSWSSLPRNLLFAICIYLFCTTTVHPWYASLPILLCVFTRYRFPILWAGLIVLTYHNYSYAEYREDLWLVAVEYLAVGLYLVYEISRRPTNVPKPNI